jgi:hypothetical protein
MASSMLTLAELGPALYGAWRLAHFDPGGMRYFDRSLHGFWRSFWAAPVAAPFVALLIALRVADSHVGGGLLGLVLGEAIAYVIGVVAFPLAAFYITRLIDREREYLGFIVAYNWSGLLQLAVILPAVLLAVSGVFPGGAGSALIYAAQIAVLIYEWFVVRTALRLPGFGAAGVVVIDFVLSLIVQTLGDMLARVG